MAIAKIYDNEYLHLNEIDWDFKNAESDSLSCIHPYPARFINELPRALIDNLKCPANTCVFDPFCGSGTTLVEAQRKGLYSIGVDLNPIACLLSKVKTTRLTDMFIITANNVCCHAEDAFSKGISSIPQIPNLDHWFKKDIQEALSCLLNFIEEVENEKEQDALKLALSSIIVRVSNQESDTRYAAISKNNYAKDVFNNFKAAYKKIYETNCTINSCAKSDIFESDILSLDSSKLKTPVGLVVTSPPYPNAYEYWLYHKYRMWWLGFDPIKVRSYEIGARPHYMKKNGQNENDFYCQMNRVFDLLYSHLIPNGHICLIIGRSIIKGREINNAKLINKIAFNHGLVLVGDIEREIASTRKSFNPSYGKIKTENLLIYRKE